VQPIATATPIATGMEQQYGIAMPTQQPQYVIQNQIGTTTGMPMHQQTPMAQQNQFGPFGTLPSSSTQPTSIFGPQQGFQPWLMPAANASLSELLSYNSLYRDYIEQNTTPESKILLESNPMIQDEFKRILMSGNDKTITDFINNVNKKTGSTISTTTTSSSSNMASTDLVNKRMDLLEKMIDRENAQNQQNKLNDILLKLIEKLDKPSLAPQPQPQPQPMFQPPNFNNSINAEFPPQMFPPQMFQQPMFPYPPQFPQQQLPPPQPQPAPIIQMPPITITNVNTNTNGGAAGGLLNAEELKKKEEEKKNEVDLSNIKNSVTLCADKEEQPNKVVLCNNPEPNRVELCVDEEVDADITKGDTVDIGLCDDTAPENKIKNCGDVDVGELPDPNSKNEDYIKDDDANDKNEDATFNVEVIKNAQEIINELKKSTVPTDDHDDSAVPVPRDDPDDSAVPTGGPAVFKPVFKPGGPTGGPAVFKPVFKPGGPTGGPAVFKPVFKPGGPTDGPDDSAVEYSITIFNPCKEVEQIPDLLPEADEEIFSKTLMNNEITR
jgi:hypothetical protein